jgi:ribosomal protein S20
MSRVCGAAPLLGRQMSGRGISPLGGMVTVVGGGITPLGGSLYPLGGARFGRMLMRPSMGINEIMRLPISQQMYGNGIVDSFKSAARSISKKVPSSLKSAASSAISSAVKSATPMVEAQIQKGISKLPSAAQPFAQMGVEVGKQQAKKGVARARSAIGMGTSELGALSAGQLNMLAQEAAKGTRRAPIMDRHQFSVLRNVVSTKAATRGSGIKKLV